MLRRSTSINKRCGFCPNNGKRDLTYVYPIPDSDNPGLVIDNREGAYACDDCLPGIRELQIEYGFLVDVNGGRREIEHDNLG